MTTTLSPKEGDLLRVCVTDNMTVCTSPRSEFFTLRECVANAHEVYSHPSVGKVYEPLEGQLALVLEIIENRLGQPLLYKLHINDQIYACKAIFVRKYFNKVS
jgi:hypothetical protein